jgi:hypothetical protein
MIHQHYNFHHQHIYLTIYFRHPTLSIPAEEFPFWIQAFPLIDRSIHHISELVLSLFLLII